MEIKINRIPEQSVGDRPANQDDRHPDGQKSTDKSAFVMPEDVAVISQEALEAKKKLEE